MAISTKITAKHFTQIGLVGQTVGFVDFTQAQIDANGGIQSMSRTFSFTSKSVLTGISNSTLGKEALVTQTQLDVDTYLATVFTDVAKTYDVNIYLINVKRLSTGIVGVSASDTNSVYVERDDIFHSTVRIDVLVS